MTSHQDPQQEAISVAIYGAGLIGTYLGLSLSLLSPETPQIHLLGRTRLENLHKTLYSTQPSPGFRRTLFNPTAQAWETTKIPSTAFTVSTSLPSMMEKIPKAPDVIVVTVKRFDNATIAESFKAVGLSTEGRRRAMEEGREWYWASTTILMMQNGAGAAAEMKRLLGEPKKSDQKDSKVDVEEFEMDVVDGMWPFNVVEPEEGVLQEGSVGVVCLEDGHKGLKRLGEAMEKGGVRVRYIKGVDRVCYGKVVMNLNNAVSALSGLPLKQEMHSFQYREVLSRCQVECLKVYKAEGIDPIGAFAVNVFDTPSFLMLPDVVYASVAGKIFAVSDKATSSMYEDIKANRATEIDYFQGEVSRLGKIHGIPTPVCDRVVELVRKVESMKVGIVAHTREEILAAIYYIEFSSSHE
ncbi:hypothetical protein HDU97_007444 [Phlyctochytrium planicorne]|nr:hypothetical protein HDU97_007444 [Phlyctochytrium planicorne]